MTTNKRIALNGKDNSKQELAYVKIKTAIIKNELPPDMPLVERQLCSLLGISRTPLREALRRLSSEGLVESITDKGVFVSKIRLEDLLEIYQLREALEGLAVKLFVQRKDPAVVNKMEECLELYEQALAQGHYDTAVEKDIEFHQLYINGSRNTRLINFLNTIVDQLRRVAFHTVNDTDRVKLSLEQHKKVMEAIRKNDADLAEKLLKEHIVNVKEYHIGTHYLW